MVINQAEAEVEVVAAADVAADVAVDVAVVVKICHTKPQPTSSQAKRPQSPL